MVTVLDVFEKFFRPDLAEFELEGHELVNVAEPLLHLLLCLFLLDVNLVDRNVELATEAARVDVVALELEFACLVSLVDVVHHQLEVISLLDALLEDASTVLGLRFDVQNVIEQDILFERFRNFWLFR